VNVGFSVENQTEIGRKAVIWYLAFGIWYLAFGICTW
jgi:hypothetical protein